MAFVRDQFNAIRAGHRPLHQSLFFATVFAIDAAACAGMLHLVYWWANAPGVAWAIVSAILVLIPDLRQSLSTALARVAANIIGATIGLIVGATLGQSFAAVLFAVVIVSYVCHVLRLDLGLRTACVCVIIVLAEHDATSLALTGLERFTSVLSGCGVGVAVQLTTLAIQNRLQRADVVAKRNADLGG